MDFEDDFYLEEDEMSDELESSDFKTDKLKLPTSENSTLVTPKRELNPGKVGKKDLGNAQ